MSMTPLLGQRPRAERAFERLYKRHVGDVYRYSLALLRNPVDAEDVTQTTFLNAYRAFRSGDRPDSPRSWLIAIAHNVCRQRFRTAQRRVQEVAFEETVAEAVVPDPEGPRAEEIQRALAHLAFNQRAALVMRELEGRSYAEIAELLGVSTSAVETLLFRARRALREQLEGALSCDEAEVAISKQLDGRLPRAERGALRAHLRECEQCGSLARKQRAQRSAIRALGLLPLPSSLATWGGGGAAAAGTSLVGGGVAMKAAALVATGTVAVGVGYEATQHVDAPPQSRRAAPAVDRAAPASAPTLFVTQQAHALRTEKAAATTRAPARAVPGGKPAAPPGAARASEAASVEPGVNAHARSNAAAPGQANAQRPRARISKPAPPTKAKPTAGRGRSGSRGDGNGRSPTAAQPASEQTRSQPRVSRQALRLAAQGSRPGRGSDKARRVAGD